jgi:HK97 family phage portal protein
MSWIDALLGRDARLREEVAASVVPGRPRASSPYDAVWVGDRSALSVPAIFAAIDLIAGTVAATPFAARRGPNDLVMPTPPIVARPDPGATQTEFLYDFAFTYCLRGEVFLRQYARGDDGFPKAVAILPNDLVDIARDGGGRRVFRYQGTEYSDRDIRHVYWARLPGEDHGVGPVQLARLRIAGEIASHEFTRRLFTDGGLVTAILKHPLTLDAVEAKALKAAWIDAMSGTREPAVLSGGIEYEGVVPNLVDMALADLRKEGVLDVARLFKVPPTLLAAEIGGSSLTYQNVDQVWLNFLRLQMPLFRKIESIWSDALPRGTNAYADLDAWLRPDPKGQLDAVIAGIAGGVFTVEEGRRRLGLPPDVETSPEGMRPVSGGS